MTVANVNASHSGNVEFLYSNFIEAGTQGEKDPFVAAAQQMVENSDDAGATRIDFQIKPSQYFRCIDDGIGVLRAKMAGLNRLGFRNKGFDKTGKNGTGRAFNMKIANETRSRFTSADFARVMLHQFTRDHVKTILSNPTQPLDNPIIEDMSIPEWCRHLSGSKTGMAVELADIDWELFTSLAKFRRRLSEVLSVWMAEKTYVEGELIPQREMDGKFDGTVDLPADFMKCLERLADEMKRKGEIDQNVTIDALKTCKFFFYRTSNPTKKDRIFFGRNPLISVDDFLAGVRDDLLVDQLNAYKWIRGKTVAGFLDIPIINQFAHHSRGTLNPSIYDNPELIEQVVYFIADHIAPMLEARYNLQEDQGEAAEKQNDLQMLAGMFPSKNPFGGSAPTGTPDGEKPAPPGPRNRPDIAISPPKAEKHVIGQEQLFKVVRGPRNGKWRWARNNPGGTLDVEAGPQVWVTYCDKPGKYTLEYVAPDGKKTTIPIELVEEAPFKLSQGVIDLYPGQEGEVFVLNYDGSDVRFEFDEEKRPVKHLRCENLGKGARFIAGHDCPAGYYKYLAQGSNGEKANGVVRIHHYPGEFIPIGDKWYELKRNTPKSPLVEISRWYGNSPDGTDESTYTMLINTEADPLPEMEKQSGKGEAYFQTLRMACVMAHVLEHGADDPLGSTLQLTTDAMKQAKKKKKK
jgi:hypothetical protein